MSYKALYRTYRPQQFDEVVGQDHIVKTLKNIIELDKVSHAYLFAGPRGTGKTSIAHIFARTLNCQDIQSKTTICQKCAPCLDKNNLDIIEIDAASNNGVAEVRTLIGNSKYAPSISKYKVYIIDEVHMLSKGAFNALLKTLEEPPEYVIFILATTEPHKIPVTILSRTQRFNFRRIGNEEIIKRLKFVLGQENIKYDNPSLKLIANLAKGGMRDALSIADQGSAYSNNGLMIDEISKVFGVLSNEKIVRLLNHIYLKRTKEVLQDFSDAISEGFEINRLIESIIGILKDFIVYDKTKDISLMHIADEDLFKEVNFTITFAFDALDTFVKVSSDLKFSEVPSQVFELGLLKSLSLKEDASKKEIKPKVKNIFDTKEIIVEEVSEEIVVEKEETPESIQEKIEKTMELTLNQDVIEEHEETKEIEEEILNQKSFKDTDELNIGKLFSSDDTKEVFPNETKSMFSSDDIINLLLQANKDSHISNKEKWFIKEQLSSPEDRQLMNLFEKTNLISSSDVFMLLESDNISVIKEINRVRKEVKTISLIEKIIGKPLLIFAITKDEFESVKSTWINLAQNDALPKPKPIEKLEPQAKEENKAEEFGTSLFGDIFES